jgi:hypothetical protein
MRKNCALLGLLPLLATAWGCVGASKSANPLSPSIAGPIAGVGITAPTVVEPAIDALVNTTTQPITLKVGNGISSGVRPLTYTFEVATDPGFANKVVAQAGVPPGEGITSFRLPASLAPERKYYWHARADDGANASLFSATSAFNVFTPVVFGVPRLREPIGNTTTTTPQPRLVITNASRSGPVQRVYYYIEISTSASLKPLIGSFTVAETPNETALTVPIALAAGTYYWRAQATDLANSGAFSSVASFVTAAATPPPGGGGGGGGGGVYNGTMIQTLNAVRAEYPTNWSHEDRGKFLNKVAWIRAQMGEPFGLLRKPGGNRCPTPQKVDVSCDYLVYKPTMNGYDVLVNEQTPTWKGLDSPTDNFSDDPGRFLVPIAP